MLSEVFTIQEGTSIHPVLTLHSVIGEEVIYTFKVGSL